MTDPLASLTRKENRASSERADLDRLLDEVPTGVLSTVLDGQPWAVPMLFARDGDRILLHGSTGAGALRHTRAGAPVAFTVHALDGLVFAWNGFESSANYRSAVLRGTLTEVPADQAAAALDHITDVLLPGRMAEIPSSTRKERAATTCLALAITDGSWIYKARNEGSSPPEDGTTDVWTGVVPLRTVAGEPARDEWNTSGVPLPDSIHTLRDRLR